MAFHFSIPLNVLWLAPITPVDINQLGYGRRLTFVVVQKGRGPSRFSIDDFGTGHSTLNRLEKLPIPVLKVDRTFTERLCEENGTHSIVQAMISMAKALQLRVVAEGVEREEEILELSAMRCDCLQGFALSRPISSADVPHLLERRHPLLARRFDLSSHPYAE